MKPPVRVVVLALLTLAANSACSSTGRSGASGSPSGAQPSAQAAPAVATPCTAAMRGIDVSTWQLVAANGFTFCVPPDWRGRGGTWRQGRTELSWGTGTPPRGRVVDSTRAVVRRIGELPMPPAGSEATRFNEEIGGRTATLWRNRSEGTYYTGAQWDAPTMWLRAETPDAAAADLVLQIARTVRFVSK